MDVYKSVTLAIVLISNCLTFLLLYLGITYPLIGNTKAIKKNTMVGTVLKLYKIFDVTFEMNPYEMSLDYKNVLLMTSNKNALNNYGGRIPAISFKPANSRNANKGDIQITCSVSGQSKHFVVEKVPIRTWTKIKVQQNITTAGFLYSIWVNDQEMYNVINTDPRIFDNVKVFVSNWASQQQGQIRNLVINTSPTSPDD